MKLLLPVIIVLIVIVGGYFIANQSLIRKTNTVSQTPTPSPLSQELETFESKNMKFKVDIPREFKVVDKSHVVELSSPRGLISITNNNTNFDNLKDYISNFDSKRELISLNEKSLVIDQHQSLSRVAEFPKEKLKQKSYYIYINNSVYIFSTTVESLYDDLDQIAQSFRYLP